MINIITNKGIETLVLDKLRENSPEQLYKLLRKAKEGLEGSIFREVYRHQFTVIPLVRRFEDIFELNGFSRDEFGQLDVLGPTSASTPIDVIVASSQEELKMFQEKLLDKKEFSCIDLHQLFIFEDYGSLAFMRRPEYHVTWLHQSSYDIQNFACDWPMIYDEERGFGTYVLKKFLAVKPHKKSGGITKAQIICGDTHTIEKTIKALEELRADKSKTNIKRDQLKK